VKILDVAGEFRRVVLPRRMGKLGPSFKINSAKILVNEDLIGVIGLW
jgi:hypothetical protein